MTGQNLDLTVRAAPARAARDPRQPAPAGREAPPAGPVAIMERATAGRYGLPVVDGGSGGAWPSRQAAGVIAVSASAPPRSTPDTRPPDTRPVATAEVRATIPARPEASPTAPAPVDDPVDPVSESARLLLRLMVANQEREQRHLGDVFHDGPIQDFTAVLLACSAVRRTLTGPEAERLADVEAQLRGAITTLRLPPPAFRASNDARMILESALASRVHGPLTRTLETVIEVGDPAPTRAEIAELLGALQILLLESDPLRPAANAAVTIRSGNEGLALTLHVMPDPMSAAASPDAARDAGARTDRLSRVAALTGAQISEEAPGGSWRASLAWPRPAPRPPVAHTRIEQRPGLAAYQPRPADNHDGVG
ncbi:hypothetical protein [Pseudofrankia sp. EUN1h]|uniref:hypothetical protein n=1 Tax=Pseudofrankia sp. EUN1h TaxID=1834515 RepID=UPI0008DA6327|nr:hypothetical protein [Pseudofrankia sp. EUN1h]OHV42004.1 hypothetical protein BCD49_00065 [Pseudofrankia sp. EUN1h]